MKSLRFNNLIKLEKEEIEKLLDKVADNKLIAISLKNMTVSFKDVFFANMSESRKELILAEEEKLGFIKLDEIKNAKKQIEVIAKEIF